MFKTINHDNLECKKEDIIHIGEFCGRVLHMRSSSISEISSDVEENTTHVESTHTISSPGPNLI